MPDDIIKLGFQLDGTLTATEFKDRLDSLNAELGETAAALGRSEITMVEYNQQVKIIQESIRNTEAVIHQLTEAENENTDATQKATLAKQAENDAIEMGIAKQRHELEMQGVRTKSVGDFGFKVDEVKGKTKDWGQAALQASRGFEDLQYGIGGVLNNIPGVISALGGPAGLVAAISATAVGAKVLYDHWGDLMKLFGQESIPVINGLNEQIKALQAQVKELESKTMKFTVDSAQLDEAKRKLDEMTKGQAAFQAMQRGLTPEQEEAGKLTKELIKIAGEAEVSAKLEAAQIQKNIANSMELRKAKQDAEDAKKEVEIATAAVRLADESTLAGHQKRLDEAGAKLDDANRRANAALEAARSTAAGQVGVLTEKAAGAFGGAAMGPARKTLTEMLGQVGKGDLAAQIMGITPDDLAAYDKEAAEFQAALTARKEASARVREKAKANAKQAKDADHELVEQLNTQGGALQAAVQGEIDALKDSPKIKEKAAKEAKKKADEAAKLNARDIDKAIEEERKARESMAGQIAKTGRGAMAQMLGMQVGAAGGNQAQQTQAILNAIMPYIRSMFPGMNPFQQRALGMEFANKSLKDLQTKLVQNDGNMLLVAKQLDGEVAKLRNAVDWIGQEFKQLARKGQARGRNALKVR